MSRLGSWRAHGVALPEFLVALACALAVFGAALGACCALGRVLQIQDAAAARRAEAMVGLGALRDAIEWAGSQQTEGNSDTGPVSGFPRQTSVWPARLAFSERQVIAGGAWKTGAASRDFVAVRGKASMGGVLQDCPATAGGRGVPPSATRLSVYAVRDGRLLCQSRVVDREATVSLSEATGLRLRYGVDLNRDGAVDRYLDAAQVDAVGAWDAVRSVEITLDLAAAPRDHARKMRRIVALRARL